MEEEKKVFHGMGLQDSGNIVLDEAALYGIVASKLKAYIDGFGYIEKVKTKTKTTGELEFHIRFRFKELTR